MNAENQIVVKITKGAHGWRWEIQLDHFKFISDNIYDTSKAARECAMSFVGHHTGEQ